MSCFTGTDYISTYERRCNFMKMTEKIIIKERNKDIIAVKNIC